MKDIEIVAKNIREINGQTFLSYKREKRGKHAGYRWIWSFSIRNIETNYVVSAKGKTPEKAFNRFVKMFYEKGFSEKYNQVPVI